MTVSNCKFLEGKDTGKTSLFLSRCRYIIQLNQKCSICHLNGSWGSELSHRVIILQFCNNENMCGTGFDYEPSSWWQTEASTQTCISKSNKSFFWMACVAISADLSFISAVYTLNQGIRACFLPFSPLLIVLPFLRKKKQNGRGIVSLPRPFLSYLKRYKVN